MHPPPATTAASPRSSHTNASSKSEIDLLKIFLRLNTHDLDKTEHALGICTLRFGSAEDAYHLCNAYLQKTHTAVALTNLVIVGSYLGALTRIETKAILQTHSLDARINACSPYVEGCRKAIRDFDPSKRPLLIDRRKKDLPHALKKSSYKLVVYTAGALRVLTAEEAALRLREIAGGKTNYKESTKLEAHVQKTIEGLSKRLQQKPRAATLSLEALRTPHLAKKALRSIFT